jgi:hypothetical protein
MISDIVNIADIEKQYEDEWLLFEVVEADDLDRPIKGRFLGHSKSREEIHQVIMEKRSPDKCMYIRFNGDPVPPDMVVVL